MPYEYPKFEYRRSPDQDTADPVRHPVVIIGAGPVGLDLTIDPAFKQVSVVLLEALDTISIGSRAICFAKRTLEVCERIGLGGRLLEKGATWKKAKCFSVKTRYMSLTCFRKTVINFRRLLTSSSITLNFTQ